MSPTATDSCSEAPLNSAAHVPIEDLMALRLDDLPDIYTIRSDDALKMLAKSLRNLLSYKSYSSQSLSSLEGDVEAQLEAEIAGNSDETLAESEAPSLKHGNSTDSPPLEKHRRCESGETVTCYSGPEMTRKNSTVRFEDENADLEDIRSESRHCRDAEAEAEAEEACGSGSGSVGSERSERAETAETAVPSSPTSPLGTCVRRKSSPLIISAVGVTSGALKDAEDLSRAVTGRHPHEIDLSALSESERQRMALTKRFWLKEIPDVSVEAYLQRLDKYCRFSTSVYFTTFYLLRELCLEKKYIPLTAYNVHRLLLAALRISCKLVEDVHHKQVYYAKVAGVSTSDLYRLEISFLFMIDFEVKVDKAVLSETLESMVKLNLNTMTMIDVGLLQSEED